MSAARALLIGAFLVAGCYGPGTMGWGSNGTTFEVERHRGFVQVTEVGKGAMRAGPAGASPQYDGDLTQWDEFSIQFELSGMRVAFNRPADGGSQLIPGGKPWPLTNVANGTVRLGDRLNFCHMEADHPPYRFGVLFGGSGGRVDHNLWFEQVPRCVG
jgi:hypothetical protein